MLNKENIADVYPLTPLQEGMLYHARTGESSSAYFEQFIVQLRGELDAAKFEASWNAVIARHAILRTVFAFKKTARPLQMVLKSHTLALRQLDWRKLARETVQQRLTEFYVEDRHTPFELNREVALRVTLIQTADDAWEMIWSHHHILLDGWSGGLVFAEVLQHYQALREGRVLRLEEPRPFSQFVSWLEARDRQSSLDYWVKHVGDLEQVTGLPHRQKQAAGADYAQRSVGFEISPEESIALSELAKQWGITLNSLVQTLWSILLARWNGTEQVGFLATVSGRPPEILDVENMVGLFINTVPIALTIDPHAPVNELAKLVHTSWIETTPHHQAALADIQTALGRRLPMDHLLVFVSYPLDNLLAEMNRSALGFAIENVSVFEHSNYDLEFIIHPGKTHRFDWKFNSHVYDVVWMESVSQAFATLIRSCLAAPQATVAKVDLLPAVTREAILQHWNPSDLSGVAAHTIVEEFRSQAQKFADRIAVVSGARELTYRELDERSNAVAAALCFQHGVQPGEMVGLMLGRNEQMVVAMLGVLKAGGAYVPVDATYPEERIQHMVRDSGIRLLLVEEPFIEQAKSWGAPQLIAFGGLPKAATKVPPYQANKDNPAYVIYTSGSTGRPKGCVVTHGNLIQLFKNDDFQFQFSERDVWVIAHSFCFDFSVWEMYGALLFGGKVVVAERSQVQDVRTFLALVKQQRVTVLNQTPAAFYQFVSAEVEDTTHHLHEHLRYVIFGGDRLTPAYLQPWVAHYPLHAIQLINMYGITETTVHVTFHCLTAQEVEQPDGSSPIGGPLPLTTVYVCDPWMNLLPPGVPGEMYVGGLGVCKGYLNRAELTAQRFLSSPFRAGERLYKTGDLGCWTLDGKLEYLGRNDDQVQVRGFRVELGEIEARLLQYHGIKKAVVIARELDTNSLSLVAYLVAEEASDQSLAAETLRRFLSGFLPDYMVPAYFVTLAALPLTANRKVDKVALPDPRSVLGASNECEPPANETEQAVLKIWQTVLKRPSISVTDDFFLLGGHSLTATQVVSRIHKELGCELSLRDFFGNASVRGLSDLICEKESGPKALSPIPPAPAQELYDLSNAQRRLWVLDQMKGGAQAYHLFTAYRLDGALNDRALEQAFLAVIERHESLRTTFETLAGTPKQRIHSSLPVVMERFSLSDAKAIRQFGETFAARPFALNEGPLWRLALVRIAESQHQLFICLHHLITDGWSLSVMVREVAEVYSALTDGQSVPVRSDALQYKDYSEWLRQRIASNALQNEREYWQRQLAAPLPVLALPTDFPRPLEKTYVGRNLHFEFDPATTAALRALAQKHQASLFMTIVAAVKILLHRYTGQNDLIVGAPIAGRNHPELENQLGYFLNTLALRTGISPADSFERVLQKVRQTVTEAYDHQSYPFDMLVEELKLARDTSRAAVFDVLVGLQNQAAVNFELPGLRTTEVPLPTETSKFDLTFSFEEIGERLTVGIEYNSDLFVESRIPRLFRHLELIIQSGVQQSQRPIHELTLTTAAEQQALERDWNPEPSDFPEQDLASLFEEQVEKNPEAIALIFGTERLTYRELNERANQVAHALRERAAVRPDDLVALLLDRGAWMIVAILGVLKSGAGYVPIDTAYPAERVQFLLQDCLCRALITESALRERAGDISVPVLLPETVATCARTNLPILSNAFHLAYVMYTSGSSGEPKGVAVEQGSVVRLVRDTNYTQLKSGDRVLQLSNYAFDGSVFDIFGALLNGGILVLVARDMLMDMAAFVQLLRQEQVNITFITTALFNQLVDHDATVLRQFDKVYFGGQEASLKHVRKALAHRKSPASIVHVYGPTEVTTFATYFEILEAPAPGRSLPIGRAISNTTAFILDEFKNLQPPGVPGELYLGGAGLARGYWNRPDLTAAKFVNHPWLIGESLYATGDLARWNESGQIEFLGRKDGQVKVRGYRIELGEIENALVRLPNVRQAAAVARTRVEDQTKELIGYLVADEQSADELFVEDLRAALAQWLPDYMIPAHFVCLPELPLTPNGKVNTRALPAPESGSVKTRTVALPASNAQEEQLLTVMREVLGCPHMSIADNYFAVGGDSIKAIQIASRLHQTGIKLEVRDLFQYQTIAELAPRLAVSRPAAEQSAVTGEVPLSPIQHWFFANFTEGTHHFNQAVLLTTESRLDVPRLERAFAALLEHHDALRMSYQVNGENAVQEIHSAQMQLRISVVDYGASAPTADAYQRELDAVHASFDLAQAPLIAAKIFRLPDADRLLISIHHLVIDAVSWRILMEDLETLYQQAVPSAKTLPPKTVSFAAWSRAVSKHGQTLTESDEARHWSSIHQLPQAALFASSQTADNGRMGDVAEVKFTLSEAETSELLTAAGTNESLRIEGLLLGALTQAVKECSALQKLVLVLERHGRGPVGEQSLDINRTVGWFTSFFPLMLDVSAADAVTALKNVQTALRGIPGDGSGYAQWRYGTSTGLAQATLPASLSFNYLGQFATETQSTFFKLDSGDSGKVASPLLRRPYELDIVGAVYGTQLAFTIQFSQRQYQTAEIQKFANALRAGLTGIAQAAANVGEEPAWDYAGLNDNQLDNLLEELGR